MGSSIREAVKAVEREKKAKEKDPLLKKLPTGFADEAEKMSEQELRDCIVQSNTNIMRIKEEMEVDEKLNGAKAIVQDLTGPYNDAKKAQQAKIDYCLRILDEKGVLGEGDDE